MKKMMNFKMRMMQAVWLGLICVMAGASDGWADIGNQTGALSGATPYVYRLERNVNNTMSFKRNNSTSGITQPGGSTLSDPALTTLNGVIYAVHRTTNNGIYCNRYTPATNSWIGWVNVGGATIDAPVISSNGSAVKTAIRGTDNGLYVGDVTNCQTVTWSWITSMQYAPQMVSDFSGFYVYYTDTAGAVRRYTIGVAALPRVHGFGMDEDLVSTRVKVKQGGQEFLYGHGPSTQAILDNWATGNLAQANATCNTPSITGLNLGGNNTPSAGEYRALCLGVENTTGDIRRNMRAKVLGNTTHHSALFGIRACTFGFWQGGGQDACDFNVAPSYFPSLAQITSINLRYRANLYSADTLGTVPGSLNSGHLAYFLFDKRGLELNLPIYSRTMEMAVFAHINNASSYSNTSSFREWGGSIQNSALGKSWGASQFGGAMLTTTRTTVQNNLNLKAPLVSWIQDPGSAGMVAQWKVQAGKSGCSSGNNWCGMPLPTTDVNRWAVVFFSGPTTEVTTGGSGTPTRWLDWLVDDYALEVLW